MKCPLCTNSSDQTSQENCPLYDVRTLITQGALAKLVLDGQTYVLRITRAGKLILTK